jgi:hypothetical protein
MPGNQKYTCPAGYTYNMDADSSTDISDTNCCTVSARCLQAGWRLAGKPAASSSCDIANQGKRAACEQVLIARVASWYRTLCFACFLHVNNNGQTHTTLCAPLLLFFFVPAV